MGGVGFVAQMLWHHQKNIINVRKHFREMLSYLLFIFLKYISNHRRLQYPECRIFDKFIKFLFQKIFSNIYLFRRLNSFLTLRQRDLSAYLEILRMTAASIDLSHRFSELLLTFVTGDRCDF